MALVALCLDLPASPDVAPPSVGATVTHSLHRNPGPCWDVYLSGGYGEPRSSIDAFDRNHPADLLRIVPAQSRAYPGRSNLDGASAKTQETSVVSQCA